MIRKLILWLLGAYLCKTFSLTDLRAAGTLQGAMAIESLIDKDTRGGAEALAGPTFWCEQGVSVVAPSVVKRKCY